jgi:hypothetical protein
MPSRAKKGKSESTLAYATLSCLSDGWKNSFHVPSAIRSQPKLRSTAVGIDRVMKNSNPKRLFKDSWRPEDKALESAEEEALEKKYPEEIARDRAKQDRQDKQSPPVEKPPPEPFKDLD